MGETKRIVIVGAGGLGHPAALSLCEGWRGPDLLELVIVDNDCVERSNLNRQILFAPEDIGNGKACTLRRRLESKHPAEHVKITATAAALDNENVAEIFAGAALVLDCTDDIPTKFLINDYCAALGIPFCYAGAVELSGLCLAVPSQNGVRGCLRCLFGRDAEGRLVDETKNCQSAGILGPVAGLVGIAEAEAAMGLLEGGAAGAASELLRFSAETLAWTATPVTAAPDCPLGCAKIVSSRIDLTEKECPYTFLYTKLALDELASDHLLEAVFETPETRENVRRSVEQEGHRVIAARWSSSKGFHLLVEKRGAAEAAA